MNKSDMFQKLKDAVKDHKITVTSTPYHDTKQFNFWQPKDPQEGIMIKFLANDPFVYKKVLKVLKHKGTKNPHNFSMAYDYAAIEAKVAAQDGMHLQLTDDCITTIHDIELIECVENILLACRVVYICPVTGKTRNANVTELNLDEAGKKRLYEIYFKS